jgi:hypothetical protein
MDSESVQQDCPGWSQLRQELAALREQVAASKEERRLGKRQVAPFSKGSTFAEPRIGF